MAMVKISNSAAIRREGSCVSRGDPSMRHSKLLERGLDIAGKCVIAALFWWSGFDGLVNFGDVVSYVQTRPLPFPQLV
jgi:hypothetical protein